MNCWEPPNVDLNNWGPSCRYFAADDGKYFVIDADTQPAPGWVATVIRRNTAVFWCTENAGVTDLDPDFMYPPGTTPEQAITLMGYQLVDPPEGEGS